MIIEMPKVSSEKTETNRVYVQTVDENGNELMRLEIVELMNGNLIVSSVSDESLKTRDFIIKPLSENALILGNI